MKCPDDIAGVLLRILYAALLRIRQFGREGLADECEAEADHVHNLPSLLEDYSPNVLEFYWNVERVSFLERRQGQSLGQFQEEWRNLHRLMSEHGILKSDDIFE